MPINVGCGCHLLIGLNLSSWRKLRILVEYFLAASWNCQVLYRRACILSNIIMPSVKILDSVMAVHIYHPECFLKGCGLIN